MLNRIQSIDDMIIDNIPRLYSPARNRFMIFISKIGNNGFIWFLFCIPFLAVARWRGIGIKLILGMTIVHIVGEIIIKHIVGRTRPSNKIDEDDLIVARPRYYSFPSGHTAAAFAITSVTAVTCSAYVFIPAFLLALLMGFSRLYLRVHYLTDVLVGMMLGILCGILSVQLLDRILK